MKEWVKWLVDQAIEIDPDYNESEKWRAGFGFSYEKHPAPRVAWLDAEHGKTKQLKKWAKEVGIIAPLTTMEKIHKISTPANTSIIEQLAALDDIYGSDNEN